MGVKKCMYVVALLAISLQLLTHVEAGSCQDCLTNVPYQATPGCAAYDSKKDMSLPPTDLAKKCNCQLAESPGYFDLCNTTCSESLIDFQKKQVGIMKFTFSCKSQSSDRASDLLRHGGYVLSSAALLVMSLAMAL